ncbi:MAG: hypothetical protein M0R28_15635 [Pigmentiphaga sp.]|nr:hypothetical protein [Pigmentiphaga sp.]
MSSLSSGLAVSAGVRPRWWQPRAVRRLRVAANGAWCWRDAAGRSHIVCPQAIAWGPGQSWISVAGPGWRRPPPRPGSQRQSWRPARLRLTLFAGSVAADTWRRLCVASHWHARSHRPGAPGPAQPPRQSRGRA